MSQEAVLQATQTWLKDQVGQFVGRVEIKFRPYLTPSPASPDLSLTVTIERIDQQSGDDHYINEVYTVGVYVHKKTGIPTFEKRDAVLLKNLTGIGPTARAVQKALHGRGDFRLHADTFLEGGWKFTSNMVAGPWGAVSSVADPLARDADADTWLVQPLTFTGLRRVQPIEVL